MFAPPGRHLPIMASDLGLVSATTHCGWERRQSTPRYRICIITIARVLTTGSLMLPLLFSNTRWADPRPPQTGWHNQREGDNGGIEILTPAVVLFLRRKLQAQRWRWHG